MKKLIALLGCLWIVASATCQNDYQTSVLNDYPKLELINGDTLVLFKPIQIIKMNKTFVQLDSTIAINGSLRDEIALFKKNDDILNKVNDNLKKENETLVKIDKEKDSQIEILTEENKKQDKKIKLLKKMRNLYAGVGLGVGSIVTYYLLNLK